MTELNFDYSEHILYRADVLATKAKNTVSTSCIRAFGEKADEMFCEAVRDIAQHPYSVERAKLRFAIFLARDLEWSDEPLADAGELAELVEDACEFVIRHGFDLKL